MVKVMLLLKRKPGLSLEEFIERYESIHVPLALRHATPKMLRYERHFLHPSPRDIYGDEQGEPEYDVITEIWYEDMDVLRGVQRGMQQNSARVAEIIEDEEKLFDREKSRLVFVENRASELPRAAGSDTERALRRLLDKDAIVELVHRYSYLVDHERPDELAELFTEDCVVDYGPGIGPPARGRKAFRSMFRSNPEEPGRFVATSHHNANVLVRFEDDDRARVLTTVYAWHKAPDGSTPEVWGCYHDVAVRTPEGWRLAERQLRLAGTQDWDVEVHPMKERAWD